VTFLFTDIEGSTRLWEAAPDAMRLSLAAHDAVIRKAVDAHAGYIFSTGGDGFAAAFGRAADAVAAAADAQAALAAERWPGGLDLRVRMGVHTGEAVERDGDYFGSAVNRAARLMSSGHGGQVLVSAATAAVLGEGGLTDLGEHRLRDLGERQRVFQVGGVKFAPLRSLDAAPTNLPVQTTTLVGRQLLIAEVAALVESCPLVTLTGAGGVGKTRLALEVGAEALPRFPDGVWLVDLAPIAHEELVLQAVADVLGIAGQTGEPLMTTLASRLQAKRMLLIIDNCEHVLGPIARLAQRMGTTARDVHVLATSREGLGVPGERVRPVPPLTESTEAVELFLERARSAGADVASPAQVDAVKEICVRLDGLPLAIELAAARARTLSPSQIAERLGQRFRMLMTGGRTAVPRQRTLEATVMWSYHLLDEPEKLVFTRLSTMAGDFDPEAAEAVASDSALEGWAVLDAVGRLVEKSMVGTVTAPDGNVRYRLLETLRQFGADRLAEGPSGAGVQDRYAEYWRDRGVALGRTTGGPDQAAVLAAVDADVDNYRAAFAHLLTSARADDAAAAILALDSYWQIRRPLEGLRWHEQLLAHDDLEPRRRLRALSQAAQIASNLGDTFAADRHASDAISCAATLRVDPPWPALYALMMVAAVRHDPDGYRAWWAQMDAAAARSGRSYTQLLSAAVRTNETEDLDRAEDVRIHEQLLTQVLAHGDPLLVATETVGFGIVLWRLGDYERARAIADIGMGQPEAAGPMVKAGAHFVASVASAMLGDHVDAARTLRDAVLLSREDGLTRSVIEGAFLATALFADRGDIETAATILAAARRHAETMGVVGQHFFYERRMAAQRAISAYGGDLTAAEAKGTAMAVDDLVDFMLATLGAIARS
jgi:predicted ATPase